MKKIYLVVAVLIVIIISAVILCRLNTDFLGGMFAGACLLLLIIYPMGFYIQQKQNEIVEKQRRDLLEQIRLEKEINDN